jgi:hypothetical protein
MRLFPTLLGSALLAAGVPSPALAQFADVEADPSEGEPALPQVKAKVLRPPSAVVAGALERIAGGQKIKDREEDMQGDLGESLIGALGGKGSTKGRAGNKGSSGTSGGSGGFGSTGVADADRGGFDGARSGPDNDNGAGLSSGGGQNSKFGGLSGESGGSRNSQAEELANGNDSGVGNSRKGPEGNSGSSGFEGYANSSGGSASDFGHNSNGRNSGHGARDGGNGNGTATADHSTPGGMSVGFAPSGNTAKGGQSDPANGNYAAGPNSGKTGDNSAHDDGGREDGNRAPESGSSNQRNKNDNTAVEAQPDNSDKGKDQAQKSGGSAPDRPEDEGFSARTDAVGKAAARRRFDDLAQGKVGRDPLGKNRDAEKTDNDGGLQKAAGRINPLTGAKVLGAPTGSGTSPILRNEVEIAKKRKQGL